MKQVIVVNESLNMSPGKMAAMVAHGSIAFLTNWFKENVAMYDRKLGKYSIKFDASFDADIFDKWVNGSFTKIVLGAKDEAQMEEIIQKAHAEKMFINKDFFNIVDDSTEFKNVPKWACIAFRPFEDRIIDSVTGNLYLYGHRPKPIMEVCREI